MNIIKRVRDFIGDMIPRVQEYEYSTILSSRKVIKKVGQEDILGNSYYDEDIWSIVGKELEGKVETGITLYYEIVGYLPSGKMIQKGYDYSCQVDGDSSGLDYYQHRFLVYRITYTKPNGEVIEYSWQMIVEYCHKYSIEHVKELYFGKAYDLASEFLNQPYLSQVRQQLTDLQDATHHWRENWFNLLCNAYLEKDCTCCKNKVPAEGCVIRIDGKPTYSAYKLKSKRFLEGESKALDSGEVNIEEEQHA